MSKSNIFQNFRTLRDDIRGNEGVLLGILVSSVIVGLLTYYLRADPSTVLRTVATAQTSVLAIVFSVTILGVQLIANRYSPRMTSLITNNQTFILTFWALIGSAAYDLLAVLLVQRVSGVMTAWIMAGAVGLAAISVVLLWGYVNMALERSTPSGLLEAYAVDMTPVKYWEQFQQTNRSQTDRHPFHDVYEMIMASLSNQEWLTAKKGLETMERVSESVIQELSKEGTLGIRPGNRHGLFEEPLENFLPRIIVHADDEEEREIAHTAIELQRYIGDRGLANGQTWLAGDATRGLSESIRDAPDGWDGSVIRTKAFNEVGTLLTNTIQHPDPRTAETILMFYRTDLELLLSKDYPPWSYQTTVDGCFTDLFPTAFRELCEHYDEYFEDVDVDWNQDHPDRDIEKISTLALVFGLRRSLVRLTTHVLWSEERTGEFPGPKNRLVDGWRSTCEVVADSEAERLAVVLLQDFLALAYVESTRSKSTSLQWVRPFVALWNEGNEELITQALQVAREHGQPAQSFRTFSNPQEDYSNSLLRRIFKSVVSDQTEFTEWVSEFEDSLHDQVERHRN